MAEIRRSSQPRLQLYIFLNLLATVFASFPGGQAGAAEGESRMDVLGLTPGQKVLAAVPASARTSFLLYQLALAINSAAGLEPPTLQEVEVVDVVENQEQFLLSPDPNWLAAMANEFQSVPVYETFPADLQNWLTDGYGISATDVYHSWSRAQFGGRSSSRTPQLICTADGQCYEVNKIVTACCPF
ncbi:uncharacterized protein LOC108135527 isoform X1 [Drosophila elegans]|uniref:uncharacterized protein LOC108135527 isoform X1 n=1 Tax=Drosophila elegans TaxID=30023 RepID=UPI0007E67A58|nr:uncharacterized protein LOC108135527 isoform X1 [Drosophila elegans]XP_017111763.1 uncharacterized protein LOC108135527 isoform X1 [Drosophila elegans]